MTRAHLYRVIQDSAGNKVPGVSVRLTDSAGTTLSEPVYSGPTAGTTRSNPWTSVDGVVDFYLAASRRVTIGITEPGGSEVLIRDIDVIDPAGFVTNPRVITLPGVDGRFWQIKVNDDQTDTANWPNRMEVSFQRFPPGPGPGTFPEVLTFFLNEYGEVRVSPAKGSTVPFRIFTKEQPASQDHNEGVNLLEIMSDRTTRVILAGITNDGSYETTGHITASNVKNKTVCVPTGSSGFASQPDGTLWVEYTP